MAEGVNYLHDKNMVGHIFLAAGNSLLTIHQVHGDLKAVGV